MNALLRCLALVMTLALISIMSGCGTNGGASGTMAASAGPLRGQTQFALEGLDLSAVTVDGAPEKDFLAGKEVQPKASWETDKAALRENFRKAAQETGSRGGLTLGEPNHDAPFVVRPSVTTIVTGGYRPFAVAKSRMKVSVVIADRSAKAVEQFEVEESVAFDLMGPQSSLGGRLRLLGTAVGRETAKRLEKLTKG